MRTIKIGLMLGWFLGGAWAEPVRGDGGRVRLSRREGGYVVSVFTAPTPFRAGPVDISVLVQDAATGGPIPEARVAVVLTPLGRPGRAVRQAATTEAATNKLFHAAVFELPEAGRWEAEIVVEGRRGDARVRFELVAAAPAPRWPAIWPWVAWPALVILLYAFHHVLVWRKSRRPSAQLTESSPLS